MTIGSEDLSDWAMSLEKEFLLECPKCHYVFGNTATLVFMKTSGDVICKRCKSTVHWQEKRTYICQIVEPQ